MEAKPRTVDEDTSGWWQGGKRGRCGVLFDQLLYSVDSHGAGVNVTAVMVDEIRGKLAREGLEICDTGAPK